MKTLDNDAKETVKQRIENGEMSFEDSPYLTSEEKQKIKKEEKEDTQQDDVNETENDDSLLENDSLESDSNSGDYDDESDMDANEEDDKAEEPAQRKKGSIFGKIVMAILICGIAIISYSIYRRQF